MYATLQKKRGASMDYTIGVEVAKNAFLIIKRSYRKYIDEPFIYMMRLNSKIQGLLNSIKGVNIDHTATIEDIRKQIQAELTYRITSFNANFYNKLYARQEFAKAGMEFLKVINKMLELADVPVIDVTKNSFLTVLENKDYFISYGEGKPSLLQIVDELNSFYRREIDAKWQRVCTAKVLVDNKFFK